MPGSVIQCDYRDRWGGVEKQGVVLFRVAVDELWWWLVVVGSDGVHGRVTQEGWDAASRCVTEGCVTQFSICSHGQSIGLKLPAVSWWEQNQRTSITPRPRAHRSSCSHKTFSLHLQNVGFLVMDIDFD